MLQPVFSIHSYARHGYIRVPKIGSKITFVSYIVLDLRWWDQVGMLFVRFWPVGCLYSQLTIFLRNNHRSRNKTNKNWNRWRQHSPNIRHHAIKTISSPLFTSRIHHGIWCAPSNMADMVNSWELKPLPLFDPEMHWGSTGFSVVCGQKCTN